MTGTLDPDMDTVRNDALRRHGFLPNVLDARSFRLCDDRNTISDLDAPESDTGGVLRLSWNISLRRWPW